MRKTIYLILLISCLSFFSCEVKEVKDKPIQEIIETPQKKSNDTIVYQAVPSENLVHIYNQTDGIEGTFYYSGKSISLWGDNCKQIIVNFTGVAPSDIDAKLQGHITMLKKGEQLAFIEIYTKSNFVFAKFKMNGKEYYSTFNPEGDKFFLEMSKTIPVVKE